MNKIDLSKNQLIEGDVKVKYWDNDPSKARIGYLALIDHKKEAYPFFVWDGCSTGKENNYAYECNITSYKNVELIEPKYRVKDFYSLVETLKNEGFKQLKEHPKTVLRSEEFHRNRNVNWVWLLEKCGDIITEEEAIRYFNKSWLEEVTE